MKGRYIEDYDSKASQPQAVACHHGRGVRNRNRPGRQFRRPEHRYHGGIHHRGRRDGPDVYCDVYPGGGEDWRGHRGGGAGIVDTVQGADESGNINESSCPEDFGPPGLFCFHGY